MNGYLEWYRRFTWLGVVANLAGFVIPALFAPDLMEAMLGLGSTSLSYVWLAYAGFVLLQATIFYIPAAKDPIRYRLFAWLSVVGRGMAFLFWLSIRFVWPVEGPILNFWMMDGFFFIVFLILLTLGFRKSPAAAEPAVPEPAEPDNPYLVWFRRITWLAILANLALAVPALLAPAWLAERLGASTVTFTYIWLSNAGLLLAQAALYYAPAAAQPVRYRTYAWLAVFAHAAACVFWLIQGELWQLTGLTRGFFLVDGLFALVLGGLLQRGLPEPYRLHGGRVLGFLRERRAEVARAFRSPAVAAMAVMVLLVGGFVAYELYEHVIKVEPDTVFSNPTEQFKYGAIGLGLASRIPYYVFKVMPDVCPDLLPGPGGWASLGMLFEPGKELPIGFARREIGYPSVEPNCAFCHTGSYRAAEGAATQFLLGSPAQELDLQSFQWFLYNCANDKRFTADNVLAKIEEVENLGWFETQVYRYMLIPFVKTGMAQQAEGYAWQKSRPAQGRGRTDTFNPTKITVFHMPDDGTIGTVDLPAIWNQRAREGLSLHWDGNNHEITQRNFAAAMAIGATPDSVLLDSFQAVTNFVLTLPPPRFPAAVDQAKVERGWVHFQNHCADCHEFGSEKIGMVTAHAEIGTDRHRLDSFTPGLVKSLHSIDEGTFVFSAYEKTDGYSNLPIDGIWSRAPYLHNGSVPTLWDLLQPAQQRPKKFWKGYNVLDPARVGFVSDGPASASGFLLDTSLPGNSNAGHEYGTGLTDAEKWDLIEYLKTL